MKFIYLVYSTQYGVYRPYGTWYPETKTDNDITPDKYDNIIEEAENNRHANIKKTQDQNQEIWWKFNSYFLYPGEKKSTTSKKRLHEPEATDTIFSTTTSFE